MIENISRCSCIICKKEKSVKGIFTHYLIAHTDYKHTHANNSQNASNAAIAATATRLKTRIEKYNLHPTLCAECSTPLGYKIKNNKFCSHSCSATHQNKSVVGLAKQESDNAKRSRKNKLIAYHEIKRAAFSKLYRCNKCHTNHSTVEMQKECKESHKPVKTRKSTTDISGPFSKLYNCKCKYCTVHFVSMTALQYCSGHRLAAVNKRAYYKFKFNVYDYPSLFDLELLTLVGFYGPGGKSRNWNPAGLSRDHKVSVSDAIVYNYDRYYITHPMNCELMPHTENNKKKDRSSITYDKLVQLVIEFDNKNSEA